MWVWLTYYRNYEVDVLMNSYQRSELDLAFTVQPPELEVDSWNERLSTYLVRNSPT